MKLINVQVKCEVPQTAKLIGFIFETKTNYIINVHTQKIPQGIKKMKYVG